MVAVVAATVPAGALDVLEDDGALLLHLPIEDGTEWCLHWSHSVTGGPVADCFVAREGQLFLTRSYLHDHAAGLGEIPGRGTVRPADGGGYLIEGINEPISGNRLTLRVGSARVGHRIISGQTEVGLSELAAGSRVTLRPSASPEFPSKN